MVTKTPKNGVVDIEARAPSCGDTLTLRRARRSTVQRRADRERQPADGVYLEGNVIFRQDENKSAGKADQRTFRAPRAYYDFWRTDGGSQRRGRLFAPGFISP